MKNRIELARYFAKLGFKSGAEVGVFDGRYAEILCQEIPGLKLLAVDRWISWRGRSLPIAEARLKPFNVTIIRSTSMEAVKDVPDESLDFVFIDADHDYEFVRDDVREWAKKVRTGGIVSGHDYYITPKGNNGVVNAVDEYIKEHGYKLELTDWDPENKVEDERQPSWYFFKGDGK